MITRPRDRTRSRPHWLQMKLERCLDETSHHDQHLHITFFIEMLWSRGVQPEDPGETYTIAQKMSINLILPNWENKILKKKKTPKKICLIDLAYSDHLSWHIFWLVMAERGLYLFKYFWMWNVVNRRTTSFIFSKTSFTHHKLRSFSVFLSCCLSSYLSQEALAFCSTVLFLPHPSYHVSCVVVCSLLRHDSCMCVFYF